MCESFNRRLIRLCSVVTESFSHDLPKELDAGYLKADEMAVVGSANFRSLEEASNDHMLRVLRAFQGNKSKAAEILNITRSTLIRVSRKKGWDDRYADEWESE